MPRASLVCILAFAFACPHLALAEAQKDGKDVVCKRDGQELMRYRYGGDLTKPYVKELRTPAGVNILRDSPSDHKHHHGLMFAVAVDGVNFWEEREPFGREKVLEPLTTGELTTRGDRCVQGIWDSFTHKVDWMAPGKLLLSEERLLQVTRPKGTEATLLTWSSKLSAPFEAAKITGAGYFGLGMRFVESMDKDGRFVNAEGKTGVADTNAKRANWCAYSAVAEGKPVTVAMFDHPDNFRHPATWFTMEKPFAYLCATLNLKNEPITIEPRKPLVLRYGVCLFDGSVEAGQIEKLYRQWVAVFVEEKTASTRPATER